MLSYFKISSLLLDFYPLGLWPIMSVALRILLTGVLSLTDLLAVVLEKRNSAQAITNQNESLISAATDLRLVLFF